jgi:hypothetical protein
MGAMVLVKKCTWGSCCLSSSFPSSGGWCHKTVVVVVVVVMIEGRGEGDGGGSGSVGAASLSFVIVVGGVNL